MWLVPRLEDFVQRLRDGAANLSRDIVPGEPNEGVYRARLHEMNEDIRLVDETIALLKGGQPQAGALA